MKAFHQFWREISCRRHRIDWRLWFERLFVGLTNFEYERGRLTVEIDARGDDQLDLSSNSFGCEVETAKHWTSDGSVDCVIAMSTCSVPV